MADSSTEARIRGLELALQYGAPDASAEECVEAAAVFGSFIAGDPAADAEPSLHPGLPLPRQVSAAGVAETGHWEPLVPGGQLHIYRGAHPETPEPTQAELLADSRPKHLATRVIVDLDDEASFILAPGRDVRWSVLEDTPEPPLTVREIDHLRADGLSVFVQRDGSPGMWVHPLWIRPVGRGYGKDSE